MLDDRPSSRGLAGQGIFRQTLLTDSCQLTRPADPNHAGQAEPTITNLLIMPLLLNLAEWLMPADSPSLPDPVRAGKPRPSPTHLLMQQQPSNQAHRLRLTPLGRGHAGSELPGAQRGREQAGS